ncbi:hypothetical protein JOD67_004122 [Tenggerimyces flavus]|nr:hypothetical protein [Tenggerimyces flavus]
MAGPRDRGAVRCRVAGRGTRHHAGCRRAGHRGHGRRLEARRGRTSGADGRSHRTGRRGELHGPGRASHPSDGRRCEGRHGRRTGVDGRSYQNHQSRRRGRRVGVRRNGRHGICRGDCLWGARGSRRRCEAHRCAELRRGRCVARRGRRICVDAHHRHYGLGRHEGHHEGRRDRRYDADGRCRRYRHGRCEARHGRRICVDGQHHPNHQNHVGHRRGHRVGVHRNGRHGACHRGSHHDHRHDQQSGRCRLEWGGRDRCGHCGRYGGCHCRGRDLGHRCAGRRRGVVPCRRQLGRP